MSPRTIAIILIAAGVVVALASLLADTLGLGSSAGIFGTRQLIGIIAGIVIAGIGVVLYLRAGRNTVS